MAEHTSVDRARSDVLIIGAGSAGCVLAERLSSDPACRVTVVESGPGLDDRQVLELTRLGSQLPIGIASPVVEHYPARLTEHPHRPVRLVRGAMVGGSGAVNGGYFCRALPEDFDRWDLPGWSWADVSPHYRAIENDLDFGGDPSHGDRGPIPVRRTRELSANATHFVESALAAGHRWVTDMNSDEATDGVGAVPLNIVDGVRTGPGLAYLAPVISRPNLEVITGTRANRIRMKSGRVKGVETQGPLGDRLLEADRIVLCAGAIGSAHVLMLSGVGDEQVLRRAGVPVVERLPVGQNCMDHPEWVLAADWDIDPDRPVLEVVLSAEGVEIRPYIGGYITMTGGHSDHPLWPHIGVSLMQPRARGRMTLKSADPQVYPMIEQRYDAERADLAALHRGSALARELCSGVTRLDEPKWSTSQHFCGTAPMGVEGDEHAVLDPRCRVRGVDGLWVVDGSVMPSITSRGPHATIAMIAHRAAEFIRTE